MYSISFIDAHGAQNNNEKDEVIEYKFPANCILIMACGTNTCMYGDNDYISLIEGYVTTHMDIYEPGYIEGLISILNFDNCNSKDKWGKSYPFDNKTIITSHGNETTQGNKMCVFVDAFPDIMYSSNPLPNKKQPTITQYNVDGNVTNIKEIIYNRILLSTIAERVKTQIHIIIAYACRFNIRGDTYGLNFPCETTPYSPSCLKRVNEHITNFREQARIDILPSVYQNVSNGYKTKECFKCLIKMSRPFYFIIKVLKTNILPVSMTDKIIYHL